MGSGEFDGGSSVTWKIEHTEGESGSGHKDGANGKDKHPRGSNGKFVITITGKPPIIVPSKGTIVRVIWGDEADTEDAAPVIQLAGARKGKPRKSKTTG